MFPPLASRIASTATAALAAERLRALLPLCVVALGYFLLGRLGLLLTIPEGFPAHFGPAAGFAVAILVARGLRHWPGILLGAALHYLSLSDSGLATTSGADRLLLAIVIAAAATLQAVCGALLIRRCVGYPHVLDRLRDILLWLGLAGPVATLIGAAITTAALRWSGGVDTAPGQLAWTWWSGETLGVLIFLPLTMLLIAQPRSAWAHRGLAVGLPLLGALLIAVTLQLLAHRAQTERLHNRFNMEAQNLYLQVQGRVDGIKRSVHQLALYLGNVQHPQQADFDHHAALLLKQNPGLLSLEWVPQVPAHEREAFERSMQAAGHRDFAIWERDAQAGRRTPDSRAVHYPVALAYPPAPAERARGLDLGDHPRRRQALEVAARSGRLSVASGVRLLTGAEGGLFIVPVFTPDAQLITDPSLRARHLRGYAVAVVRLPDLILPTLGGESAARLHPALRDLSSGPQAPVLFSGGGAPAAASAAAVGLRWQAELNAGDARWQLELTPSTAFLAAHGTPNARLVLIGALLFAALLGGFLLLLTGRMVRIEAAMVQRTRALRREIDDRWRMEAALRRSEQLFRSIFETASDVMLLWDQNKHLLYANRSARELLGVRELADLRGDIENWPAAARAFQERWSPRVAQLLIDGHEARFEDIETGADETRHSESVLFPVRDTDGRIFAAAAVYRDITERRHQEAHIQKLAFSDALTGLANRQHFTERLEVAITQARRNDSLLAVHFIDLDHFKDINDTLGHPVGDEILIQLAGRLRLLLRRDDLLARFGGDEFAVLQTDVRDVDGVADLAERINQRMATPLIVNGYEVRTSVSIGVALFDRDHRPAATDPKCTHKLMEQADIALYQVKESRRGGYRLHDAEMSRRVHERIHIGHELERVLATGTELRMEYQPQLSLRDGSLTGFEALLRWHSPTLGQMDPATFVGIAESRGLIVELGRFTLRQACKVVAESAHFAAQPELRMAVNVSVSQFTDQNFVDDTMSILRAAGVPPRRLELEVTEGVLARSVDVVEETMQRLRGLGFSIAVDDFGTGYSSLLYLKRLPVNRIKVAQEFVRDMLVDPADAEIVRATVHIADAMDLEVIAEGVESEAHALALTKLGCRLAQGYYFSRSLTSAGMKQYLRRHYGAAA